MNNEIVEMASSVINLIFTGVLILAGHHIKKYFEKEIQKIENDEEKEKVLKAFNELGNVTELVVTDLQQTVADGLKKEISEIEEVENMEDIGVLDILKNQLKDLKGVALSEVSKNLNEETKEVLQKACVNFEDYTNKLIEQKVRELKV